MFIDVTNNIWKRQLTSRPIIRKVTNHWKKRRNIIIDTNKLIDVMHFDSSVVDMLFFYIHSINEHTLRPPIEK